MKFFDRDWWWILLVLNERYEPLENSDLALNCDVQVVKINVFLFFLAQLFSLFSCISIKILHFFENEIFRALEILLLFCSFCVVNNVNCYVLMLRGDAIMKRH